MITMHTLQPRCQIPQLPTGEEAGYTELCPPPSWASLCLNHSGSALSKERSRSLQQPLARSPTFLMTTGIIQRERVKTHPKVWRGKAFHPACGLCVLCNKLPSHSFGCSPAPCSHDPKGPAPLTGHRPGARARLSSFIMSQDGTLRLVPTVFCKMLIFQ